MDEPVVTHPVRAARGIGHRGVLAAVGLAVTVVLAGCGSSGGDKSGSGADGDTNRSAGTTSSDAPKVPPAKLTSSVRNAANVSPDTAVSLAVAGGTLRTVLFRDGAQRLRGTFNADRTRWTAPALDQGAHYTIKAAAADSAGKMTHKRLAFSTRALTKDQQAYPTILPADDQVVGIGMPVIVNFDRPVHDRAAFERKMTVTSTPSQPGSWYWLSDNVAHWRPKVYWKPGTKVDVAVDVKSVNAGNGIYGQLDQHVHFTVGQSIVLKSDVRTDQMRVFIGGKLVKSIPITAGQPGFETRSGVKVIMEKYNSVEMRGESIGISKDNPQYFDIPDVRYAERLTNSGEFFHAAPWSLYAQGKYNVSHGCMGMSIENAYWLYERTHVGDIVVVTGTNRPMEPGNGWTDWNVSWPDYQKGSALH